MAKANLNLKFRDAVLNIPYLRLVFRNTRGFIRRAVVLILRSLSLNHPNIGIPSGFYSGSAMVRGGDCEGEILLSSQVVPPFPSTSLVKQCRLGQDGFQPWPVFWMRIPGAFLTGRSLVPRDRDGKLLAEATFSQTGDKNDPAFHHFSLGKRSMIHGNATSIVSRWGGDARGNRKYGGAGYWHWLFDSVARLSLLDRFPPDTRVITPPLSPWMRWFMDRLGLGQRLIETGSTALHVENFYFASPSSMTGCWNQYAVDFLRDRFLLWGSPSSTLLPRKFYILREGYTRRIANESQVREFLASRGWSLIAPEKLTLPDQIALFRDAEAIAGLHGSAFTNLVWASSGAKVLEFVPGNFMAGAFEWLSASNSLIHSFLICESDRHSSVTIDIGQLRHRLDSI